MAQKRTLAAMVLDAGINALLGIVVLAMGLVLSGQDGRMMTYAALVLALGSCQWLMSGGWRKGR